MDGKELYCVCNAEGKPIKKRHRQNYLWANKKAAISFAKRHPGSYLRTYNLVFKCYEVL